MPRRTSFSLVILLASSAWSAPPQSAPNAPAPSTAPGDAWLDLSLKARSLLVEPVSRERHEVMDPLPVPMGIRSPDGTRVAFVGSTDDRVREGHDFDLHLASVDMTQPSGKGASRRVTTSQQRPSAVQWLPDGSGVVFLAGDARTQAVWFAAVDGSSEPVRISEGTDRCSQLRVLPSGSIAYVQLRHRHRKESFSDLILQSPTADADRATLVKDRFISAFAFSPDERAFVWGGPGSLFFVDRGTGSSREVPCHAVHEKLRFHMPHELAWSPDGRVVAATLGFAGGVARGPNDDPNAPWPRMFAEDKVFFVPADWAPSDAQVKGESDAVSPFVDESKAEPAPPAGDRSSPWWIDGVPMRPIAIRWIDEREMRERLSAREHAE